MERNIKGKSVTLKAAQKGITKTKKKRVEAAMVDLNTGVRGAFDGTTDRSVWVRVLGWLLGLFRTATETQKMVDTMALWQHDPKKELAFKIFKYEIGDTLKEIFGTKVTGIVVSRVEYFNWDNEYCLMDSKGMYMDYIDEKCLALVKGKKRVKFD